MEIIFFIVCCVVALVLIEVAISFTTISAKMAGIKSTLEKLDDSRVYSGEWLFVWWPLQKLHLFPVEQQLLDFPTQKVVTGSREIKNGESKRYSQALLEIDVAMYYYWPVHKPKELAKSYRNAPSPFDKEELLEYFGMSVMAAVRRVLGRISWYECRQGQILDDHGDFLRTLNDALLDESKQQAGDGNPITEAAIRHVRFEIKNMVLPPGLENAISLPQIADYEATATKITAEAKKEEKRLKGAGDADAREAIFATVDKLGERGLQMETLLTLREMAQGTSNTILYGLPPQVANILQKGGYFPSEEEMGKFVSMLIAELEKRKIIK